MADEPVIRTPHKQFEETRNSAEALGYILALRDRGLLQMGRNKKKILQALILREFGVGVDVSHSIEYDGTNDVLYEIGRGVTVGAHIASGNFGTAKVAARIREFKPDD